MEIAFFAEERTHQAREKEGEEREWGVREKDKEKEREEVQLREDGEEEVMA